MSVSKAVYEANPDGHNRVLIKSGPRKGTFLYYKNKKEQTIKVPYKGKHPGTGAEYIGIKTAKDRTKECKEGKIRAGKPGKDGVLRCVKPPKVVKPKKPKKVVVAKNIAKEKEDFKKYMEEIKEHGKKDLDRFLQKVGPVGGAIERIKADISNTTAIANMNKKKPRVAKVYEKVDGVLQEVAPIKESKQSKKIKEDALEKAEPIKENKQQKKMKDGALQEAPKGSTNIDQQSARVDPDTLTAKQKRDLESQNKRLKYAQEEEEREQEKKEELLKGDNKSKFTHKEVQDDFLAFLNKPKKVKKKKEPVKQVTLAEKYPVINEIYEKKKYEVMDEAKRKAHIAKLKASKD